MFTLDLHLIIIQIIIFQRVFLTFIRFSLVLQCFYKCLGILIDSILNG